MTIMWVVVSSLSVVVPGELGDQWSGSSKWTDKYEFVSEQACKDYKRSDAFLDRMFELKGHALKMVGNPQAKIDLDSVCEAVGDPA